VHLWVRGQVIFFLRALQQQERRLAARVERERLLVAALPWLEFAHFATGLLEAYSERPDAAKIEGLLQTLARHFDTWPAIGAVLQRKEYIRGHTPVFAPRKIR
jgi:hypothetical protein